MLHSARLLRLTRRSDHMLFQVAVTSAHSQHLARNELAPRRGTQRPVMHASIRMAAYHISAWQMNVQFDSNILNNCISKCVNLVQKHS